MTDIFDDAPKLTKESMKINLEAEAALAEIKPRIDGDGVGWCDDECPQYDDQRLLVCALDREAGMSAWTVRNVCPHHTARMAALLRSISIAHPDEPVAEFQHNIDDLLGGE